MKPVDPASAASRERCNANVEPVYDHAVQPEPDHTMAFDSGHTNAEHIDVRHYVPRISVVVPTYKRPDLLQRCLNALVQQTVPTREYEVIVADDGPDDDTRSCVDTIAQTTNVVLRYVPVTTTQGPAGARNAGWRAARAEIIAFTDDDTIPEVGWLAAALKHFTPDVMAATGQVIMPISDPPTDYELDANGLTRAEFVTANCFVRRSVLEDIGGFDERFQLAWREDSDLHFALLTRGYGIGHIPEAAVLHPVRPAPMGVSIKQQRKVVFDALLYKKWPRLYRTRIRPRPPWNYLAIVACLAIAAVAVLAGVPRIALLALVAWAALTLHFCWLRLRRTARTPKHILEMLYTSVLIPPLAVYWRLVGAWRFRTAFL